MLSELEWLLLRELISDITSPPVKEWIVKKLKATEHYSKSMLFKALLETIEGFLSSQPS